MLVALKQTEAQRISNRLFENGAGDSLRLFRFIRQERVNRLKMQLRLIRSYSELTSLPLVIRHSRFRRFTCVLSEDLHKFEFKDSVGFHLIGRRLVLCVTLRESNGPFDKQS